jgi:hypothetical protein
MFLKTAFLSNPSIPKNVKFLTADNEREHRALYAALFEHDDVTVISTEPVKNALDVDLPFHSTGMYCKMAYRI